VQVLGLVWLGTRTGRLAEMAAFAEDVLGLSPSRAEDGLRFYDLPDGSAFEMFDAEHEAGGHPDSGVVGGFLVDDVEAAHRELREAGFEVSELRSGAVDTWAYVRAPDGSTYEIVGKREAGADAGAAARHWATTWERAWRGHDAEALRPLYAAHRTHRAHPFRERTESAEAAVGYARWAFASERSADPWFGEPVVDGDRASVEWRAHLVGTDGTEETLIGCSLLRFDDDGLVVEQNDFWSSSTEEPGSPPG
jgi:catechol 2,3-dioxygenase-like lactoylglutathione lyase family enzyme